MTSVKWRWTEDVTIKFLEIYKQYTTLWDKNSPTYRNNQTRHLAMKAIVQQMNLPNFGIHELKKKIQALRSTYNQELRRCELKAQLNGSEQQPTLKWFSIMKSIYTKNEQGFSNGGSQLKQTLEVDQDDLPLSYFVEANKKSLNPKLENCNQVVNKTLLTSSTTSMEKKNNNSLPPFEMSTSGTKQVDDECLAFGRLVVQKMLKYPVALQVSVQQDIMDILFKADRGDYSRKTTVNKTAPQTKQSELEEHFLYQHLSKEPAKPYFGSCKDENCISCH